MSMSDSTSSIEQWKEIDGYPGYRVSDLGRAQSKRHRNGMPAPDWREITPVIDHMGYPQVRLYRPGSKPRWHLVGRLVLTTFVGPPPFPEAVTRHFLNNDPLDNRSVNLRWGTQSENCQDKERHGTAQRGPNHPGWKGGLTKKQRRAMIPAHTHGGVEFGSLQPREPLEFSVGGVAQLVEQRTFKTTDNSEASPT